ncbi:uncharacterized protein C11orf97 homolog isoform X1 [Protopterus annectens]|uniref:uncharacterized protein C11orf97 homolog isoform X1 n=1 Tax=Protopterus annectens TaxID=7888 RepID=UPI001CF99DF0|nr:uncharacterized protein C11orf97 homolog isoform X1 [Protopterus annectens]
MKTPALQDENECDDKQNCYPTRWKNQIGKKFLYTGQPREVYDHIEECHPWRQATQTENVISGIKLDAVWSIKRDIFLGDMKPVIQTRNISLPASKYYSRYEAFRNKDGIQKEFCFLPKISGSMQTNKQLPKSQENKKHTEQYQDDQDNEFDF